MAIADHFFQDKGIVPLQLFIELVTLPIIVFKNEASINVNHTYHQTPFVAHQLYCDFLRLKPLHM